MEPSDLSLLVTLDALLQEGSVTRAARRAGLSTPAMSHALARIRDKIGDPLLVRSGRGMVLTPRAESLRPRVRAVVSDASNVLERARPFDPKETTRTFVVLATDYVLCVLGAALDRIVGDAAPNATLRFVPNSPDDALVLREGRADLAVGIYETLPQEMMTQKLLTDRFVVAVRKDHPTVGKRISLDQLTRLPHVQVAPRGTPGGYVDDVLDKMGTSRRVVRAVPFFLPALYLVSKSDYLLVVSERIALEVGPSLGVRVVAPPMELRPYALSLVWHPRFSEDPAHALLRDSLLRAARQRAGNVHADASTRLEKPRRR